MSNICFNFIFHFLAGGVVGWESEDKELDAKDCWGTCCSVVAAGVSGVKDGGWAVGRR